MGKLSFNVENRSRRRLKEKIDRTVIVVKVTDDFNNY